VALFDTYLLLLWERRNKTMEPNALHLSDRQKNRDTIPLPKRRRKRMKISTRLMAAAVTGGGVEKVENDYTIERAIRICVSTPRRVG
jgi:hypothetical protein